MSFARACLMLALAFAAPLRAEPPVAGAKIETQGFAAASSLDEAALRTLLRAGYVGELHDTKAEWSGAQMIAVLRHLGAPMGKHLRGDALNQVLRVHGADGYVVTFALAEFDPDLGDNRAFLAYERDGKALDDKEGPFRLIVSSEKRAARSVRQVVRIELRSVQ